MSIDTMNLEEYRELEPLYDQAKEFVSTLRTMSVSRMQRQFTLGYNRASRLCERLQEEGVLTHDNVNGGWVRTVKG